MIIVNGKKFYNKEIDKTEFNKYTDSVDLVCLSCIENMLDYHKHNIMKCYRFDECGNEAVNKLELVDGTTIHICESCDEDYGICQVCGKIDLSDEMSFANNIDERKTCDLCNSQIIFDYGEFFKPNSKRKTVYQDHIHNNDGFDIKKVDEVFFYSKEQGDKKMRELGLLGEGEESILSIGI